VVGTTLSKDDTQISNRKGRPNYDPVYKRQVALAACEPNISVAKLAQAHGLNPNMVFKWRREYRAGLLSTGSAGAMVLIPVASSLEVKAEGSMAPTVVANPGEPTRDASRIEIELNGARVRVTGMVDPIQLRLVLRCLMPV
jgi:transposase